MIRFVMILILITGFNTQELFSQVVYPTDPDTTKKEEQLQEVKQEKATAVTDIIYLHDGSKMLVDVKKIQMNDLFYSLPGETKVNKIDQRLVYKIEHKTGKIEVVK